MARVPALPVPVPRARPTLVALVAVAASVGAVVALLVLLRAGPTPARAEVQRGEGFQATVLGWSSWYGGYQLADLGTTWCIDHGSRAPDAAFAYAPTSTPDLPSDTQAAIAWALARHGDAGGAVNAAALMLAVHDLRDAVYPFGPLDLDRMAPSDLAGFGGHETAILDRARSVRSDALARRHLRGPLLIVAEAAPVEAGDEGTLVVRLTDARGAPVSGMTAHVHADGAALLDGGHRSTGADGVARFRFRAATGPNRFTARVIAPDPQVRVWGPTTRPAQRVARPTTVDLSTAASFDAEPPDGGLRLTKTDESTGTALPGAGFELRADLDGDATFESVVRDLTSGQRPVVVDGLPPGDYELAEVEVPPGYEPIGTPAVVHVPAGEVVDVTIANRPRSTGRFEKHAASATDLDMAGAVFAVSGPTDPPPSTPPIGDEPPEGGEDPPPISGSGPPRPSLGADDEPPPPGTDRPEVGRCTTDETGACTLPPGSFVGGRQYCWEEVVAPNGFGLAEPGCFVAGPAGTTVTIAVTEPVLPPPSPSTPTSGPPPEGPPPPSTELPPAGPPTGPTSPPVAGRAALPVTGGGVMAPAGLAVTLVALGAGLVAVARHRGWSDSRAARR